MLLVQEKSAEPVILLTVGGYATALEKLHSFGMPMATLLKVQR